MARTIATALSMPLLERRMRWEAMMAKLKRGSIQQWFASFVETLQQAGAEREAATQPIVTPPALWQLRSANAG
jgi:trehalose 6-phosphate synthase